jgi:hypothetical protein
VTAEIGAVEEAKLLSTMLVCMRRGKLFVRTSLGPGLVLLSHPQHFLVAPGPFRFAYSSDPVAIGGETENHPGMVTG